MKRWPCWCTKHILLELMFFTYALYFVLINLHGCCMVSWEKTLYISHNYCDLPWLSIFFFCIGAMAFRGDLIGCTVMFNELKDGKVPVQFTLNGKQITQDKILIEYNPAKESLYPFIGMGHTGIRVLAKVSTWSLKDWSDRAKSQMHDYSLMENSGSLSNFYILSEAYQHVCFW